MILLSAHLDRVIQNYDLACGVDRHVGLIDNFIGVLLTYLVLYDDVNVQRLVAEGKVGIWHNKGEEWGRLDDAPPLTKKDLAIVVDVAAGKQYDRKDFAIENIYGLSAREFALKYDLERQGFSVQFKRYNGDEDDEDEAWSWRARGVPTFSFIVPIQAKDDGWHRVQQDTEVSFATVAKAAQGLKRVLNFFAG